MLQLNESVIAIIDGNKTSGWICGRTFETNPRYNVMVGREVVKDITEDKLIRNQKQVTQ